MSLSEIPLSVWRRRGQTFLFQGRAIRYWTAGKGEPLLLIHGFPSASWSWHYLWRPLSQRYRIIACDMLGFGDSAKPVDHAYSLLEQADLQEALLEWLDIKGPVHLLGHDYGDSVAQELIARHQEGGRRVASCVFLNGGLFPECHRELWVQRLLRGPLGWWVSRGFTRDALWQSVRQIYGPNTQPSESELDDVWSLITCNGGKRVMHKVARYVDERKVHRDRWVKAMQGAGIPMRLIDGALDPVSGKHLVKRYCELMPHADTIVLEGVGHSPQTEAPQLVLRHYEDFRRKITGGVVSLDAVRAARAVALGAVETRA